MEVDYDGGEGSSGLRHISPRLAVTVENQGSVALTSQSIIWWGRLSSIAWLE